MNKNKNDDNKKIYHVLVNLTASEYALLKTIAELDRRTLADISRLILIDNASKLYYEKYSKSEKAVFIPEGRKQND